MSDALLRFENVTKSYGDFTVFSDISLEVVSKDTYFRKRWVTSMMVSLRKLDLPPV